MSDVCYRNYHTLFKYIELEVCGIYNHTICYNNGTCDNNTCICPYPYTGYDCSYTVTITSELLHMCVCFMIVMLHVAVDPCGLLSG